MKSIIAIISDGRSVISVSLWLLTILITYLFLCNSSFLFVAIGLSIIWIVGVVGFLIIDELKKLNKRR